MAASMTSHFEISFPAPVSVAAPVRSLRRRITPQAGHALEILGHAIEYLTDEFVHQGATLTAGSPNLEAVQLLMGLNRQVYFECPVAPTLGDRLRSMLNPQTM